MTVLLMQQAQAADAGKKLDIQNNNVSAQIEAIDEQQAEQERLQTVIKNQPPAYQDKVMSTPELLELTTQTAEELEPEGFQSYFLETRANYADSKTGNSTSRKTGNLGARFEYTYETANFGDLKIQAQTSQQADNKNQKSLRFEQDDQDTSLTLINNNLYLTPTVAADSALGDVSSELTDALRRGGSRVSLG
ncbi:MAG TPA: hypothetical protein PLM98_13390, partial [Thiolinea sp.]|nr:hypothetical protein [Thiolinea sp.]